MQISFYAVDCVLLKSSVSILTNKPNTFATFPCRPNGLHISISENETFLIHSLLLHVTSTAVLNKYEMAR